MNPNDFLREREYQVALALTYSFDPLFFERVVLHALWAGGTEEVHVLADASEVDRALERVHGPIRELGRRYLLSPVRAGGRFHPKLMLRFGREEGVAWVSSGNLTHGGWGLNRELAIAWRFGPEYEDTGAWVRPLVAAAREWAPGAVPARTFDRIEDFAWLPVGPSERTRLLLSGAESLAEQLLTRWRGRRFDRLRLLTGSTDAAGKILEWMAGNFGVREVTAAITASRCAWSADALDALPIDIRLHCLPPPALHAKAYHLSGPDGDVLLVGSANCTRSAWTIPPSRGGNTEMLLVYEQPSVEDLAFFEPAFEGEPLTPSEAFRDQPPASLEDHPAPPPHALRIDELHAMEDGPIAVRIANLPEGADSVELVLPRERIALRPREGGTWHGRPPDLLPPGQTAFAHVEATVGTTRLRSGARWLDDLRRLHEAHVTRRSHRLLPRLNQDSTPQEQELLVRELDRLVHDLFTDVASFRDPFRGRRANRPDSSRPAPPVDPDALIRSLLDLPVPATHPIHTDGGWSLSLSGILRTLFWDPEGAESEGTAVGEDDQDGSNGEDDDGGPGDDPPGRPPVRRVSPKARDRFRRHMDMVVARLQDHEFHERCTALQLVQAVAYPFAATMLGLRRGWADFDLARDWFLQVAGLLLHGNGDRPSLLGSVRNRYESEGAQDAFETIVGDGTLFTVVAVALLGIPWPNQVAAFRRMLLVRDLWRDASLRAGSSEPRLARVIQDYEAADAVTIMRDTAGPIMSSMQKLDHGLRVLCERQGILTVRVPARDPIDAGELIWGPKNDWALVVEPERDGKVRVYWPRTGDHRLMLTAGHFISVRQAVRHDPALEQEFRRLRGLFDRLATAHAMNPALD